MQEDSLDSSSLWGKTLGFDDGENVLVRAASGTGKSSLHAFMSGLRLDYTGDIFFDDKKSAGFSLETWAMLRREKMALVFQDLKLLPDHTVQENLELKNQLGKKFPEEKLVAYLRQLGISDKWKKKCGTLSMGQQQRVAIVRALLQPFEWLMADEPFSHLDEENISRASALMQERAAEEKAGVILMSLGGDYGMSFNRVIQL